MLPNVIALVEPVTLDGGRPPLAGGCGIGEGDVAGDVTRGFGGVDVAKELPTVAAPPLADVG